jgi:hypothetical protein
MRRGVGTLFVALLAFRMFLGPVGSTTPTTTVTTQPELAPATAHVPAQRTRTGKTTGATRTGPNSQPCESPCLASPGKDLVHAINESMGAPDTRQDLAALWNVSAPNAGRTHFLIATVPDPVHTHLSLMFDRQVVAIEEAAQQAGYLFTRSYLPWDNVQHPENPDFNIRVQERDYEQLREKYPGVLIFHNAASKQDLEDGLRPLLVFLIGETPTGGINKSQFANALKAVEDICKENKTGCAEPSPVGPKGDLFILGPTFSGSLYSLYSLVKEPPNESAFAEVTIHSGTVTGTSTIDWFADRIDPKQHYLPRTSVTFRTFQEGNSYAKSQLLRYVCARSYLPKQVAFLSEDETALGPVPTESETCPDDPGGEKGRVLHLYFPRDISQLRNAYAQETSATATAPNTPPQTTLQLNLADTGNDDDSVNSFSQGQSPLSKEAIMMGIVADLEEHDANLVVVEATNPLDIVFLVRYLRTADPDARIVTMGSDLLLPQQVNDLRLRGVLQVTPYSLIPEIDDYTITGGREKSCAHLNRIFPNEYATGTFNAMLALMRFQGSASDPCAKRQAQHPYSPNELGQQADLIPAPYAQYGWPELAGKPPTGRELAPPLWLTALGRDQFWPIDLLDDRGEAQRSGSSELHVVAASPDSDTAPLFHFVPGAWIVLCVFSAGFGLIYAMLALNGSVFSASIFLANFAPVEDVWRKATIFASGLSILGVFIALAWPSAWYPGHTRWLSLAFPIIGFFIVVDLWKRSGPSAAIALAVVSVSAYLLLCLSIDVADRNEEPIKHFLRYRYVHITSGVSPVLPFLLIFAGFLWACWHSLSGRPPWDEIGKGPSLPMGEQVVTGPEDARHQRLAGITQDRNRDLLALMSSPLINRFASRWRAARKMVHGTHAKKEVRPVAGAVLVHFLWMSGREVDGIERRGVILIRVAAAMTILLAITLLALLVPSRPHSIQSLEGRMYDWAYTILVVSALALLFWQTARVSFLWIELRRLLMALERFPLRRGFARIAGVKSRRLWELGGNTFEDFFGMLSLEMETLDALRNALRCVEPAAFQAVPDAVREFSNWMRNNRFRMKEDRIPFNRELVKKLDGFQATFAAACADALRSLGDAWAQAEWPTSDSDPSSKKGDEELHKLPLTLRLGEDFVCQFYFNFISSAFTRIRALVLTIAGLYVFVLLSFGSYPFEPASSFHTAMIFVLGLIVGAFALVYGQAHKNATISRITGTPVGKLDGEFWLKLVSFASVPLLTLLATRFPEIGGFLFSWLEPATQAFR